MYHEVEIIGNLGRDPEMRYTTASKPVTGFSVATTEKWTGADGQTQEQTIWWKVSAWGKLAEICNEYLAKGRQVFVKGTMKVDKKTGQPTIYEGKNGPACSLELNAKTVKFLGAKGEVTAHAAPEDAPSAADSDDQIPF